MGNYWKLRIFLNNDITPKDNPWDRKLIKDLNIELMGALLWFWKHWNVLVRRRISWVGPNIETLHGIIKKYVFGNFYEKWKDHDRKCEKRRYGTMLICGDGRKRWVKFWENVFLMYMCLFQSLREREFWNLAFWKGTFIWIDFILNMTDFNWISVSSMRNLYISLILESNPNHTYHRPCFA